MARRSQRIRRRLKNERIKAKLAEELENQARIKLEEDNKKALEAAARLKREEEMKALAAEAERQRQARTIATGVKKKKATTNKWQACESAQP